MEIRLLATLVESHSPKNGSLIPLQTAPHFFAPTWQGRLKTKVSAWEGALKKPFA